MWSHALNRGNRRAAVFHKPGDYDACVEAIIDARARLPVDLLGSCLMPNTSIWSSAPAATATWAAGCSGCVADGPRAPLSSALRHQRLRRAGPIPGFPLQDDDPLATVLRYVERNALPAERVARAEDGKWSSLPGWLRGDPLLWRGEVSVRDQRWRERVTEPLSAGDLQRLRHSVSRGRPTAARRGPRKRRSGSGWNRAGVRGVGLGRKSRKSAMSPFFRF